MLLLIPKTTEPAAAAAAAAAAGLCVSLQGGSVTPEAAAVLADLQRRGTLQVRCPAACNFIVMNAFVIVACDMTTCLSLRGLPASATVLMWSPLAAVCTGYDSVASRCR
jgi:hypothetical protein